LLAEPKAFRLGVVIGLVLLHAVLGVLCKQSRWVAVAHALGTLIFGLYLSLTSRELLRVACWGAYVVGAEVLWRMAQAPLPWEYAKYAVSLVLLISLMRNRPARVPWTPVVYFLLLLPAVIPTFVELPLQEVRNPLSFNLSGPLSVAVCALFFSQVEMDSRRIQRLMVSLILPVTSIAAAALLGLTLVENIEFGAGANFAASGGFGPNQVSAILGLGALNGFLLALNLQLKWKLRITFLILALWLAAQAALSFSRTGIYLLGIGLLVAIPFFSRRWLLRGGTIIILSLTVAAGLGAWAFLGSFTGGKINERFASTDVTGRDRIAKGDLETWKENILLGVGVGMSPAARARTGDFHASHVEYTRLIAEHGLLGLIAGLLLLSFVVRPFANGSSGFTKAVVLAGAVLALAALAASGMRTAMPGFLLGLTWARVSVLPRRIPQRNGLAFRVDHRGVPSPRG
jgi:hypothetical protein